MRYLKLAAFLLAVYLLQIIVISRISVLGVRPNLLLVTITLFAVNLGAEEGFAAGVIGGLIIDLLGGTYFLNTATDGLLGFLIGTLKESVIGTEEAVTITAVLAATATSFVFELIMLYFFLGKPIASPFVVMLTLVLLCVYNSVLAFISYPLLRWIFKSVFVTA